MGGPGAGKGTMSAKIVEKYNINHISTGDIFRSEIGNKTELGMLAKSYMDKGLLVPDEVTNKMVKSYLENLEDRKNGFLLDGYPRTLDQAEAFNALSEGTDLAIDKVIAESGRIDLLVTSAGMGVSGAIEFIEEEEMKRQFEVNLFGTINTVKAVLPQMRKQKRGRIICISSVAAVYSIPFQAYYSASKAAINSFVDALTNEVKSFGIEVTSVMPGDISTGFTAARIKSNAGDDVYSGVIGSAVSAMEKDEKNGMTPDSVARLVVKLAEKKHVAPLYTAGLQYKTLVFLSRLLPHKLAVKVVGGMYK